MKKRKTVSQDELIKEADKLAAERRERRKRRKRREKNIKGWKPDYVKHIVCDACSRCIKNKNDVHRSLRALWQDKKTEEYRKIKYLCSPCSLIIYKAIAEAYRSINAIGYGKITEAEFEEAMDTVVQPKRVIAEDLIKTSREAGEAAKAKYEKMKSEG